MLRASFAVLALVWAAQAFRTPVKPRMMTLLRADAEDAEVSSLVKGFNASEALLEADKDALPDLEDFAKLSDATDKPLSRSAQRRLKRERLQAEAEAREANPFSDVDISRESFLEISTKAAWGGIAALIGWELYINSPLFQRQAGYQAFPAPGEDNSVPFQREKENAEPPSQQD
mmetsp:Transcript_6331/g.24623  ORF Transcript_6331/g.24623 Transcript_6331/m.24623 type:complete len:174 (-) Transcript_6331:57-578(-)|eukprot:scaffold395_cov243-Pinguiococcus_pyrenoidosus.AAC.25